MIDFDKFAKYSRPAPRYTSYPTAVEFKDLKEEALAYKKELLSTGDKIKSATDIKAMATQLTTLDDNDWEDDGFYNEKPEEVTLKKKKKKK